MQFLIITKQSSPPPPEMAVPLMEAMEAWVAQHRASGQLTSVWGFAGIAGGGGVVEARSHEELDAVMVAFPFGPFSTIEVIALSDIDQALAGAKATFQQMLEAMGGK